MRTAGRPVSARTEVTATLPDVGYILMVVLLHNRLLEPGSACIHASAQRRRCMYLCLRSRCSLGAAVAGGPNLSLRTFVHANAHESYSTTSATQHCSLCLVCSSGMPMYEQRLERRELYIAEAAGFGTIMSIHRPVRAFLNTRLHTCPHMSIQVLQTHVCTLGTSGNKV